jgi:hypothetical protein
MPRLEGKSAVSSKRPYKIKHATNGGVEKLMATIMEVGFP